MLAHWPLPGVSLAVGPPRAPAALLSDTWPGCQPSPALPSTSLTLSKMEPVGDIRGGQQRAADHYTHQPLTCRGNNLWQQAEVSQLTNPSFYISLRLLQSHLCEGLALPLIPSATSELLQLKASLSHSKHEGRAHRHAPLPSRVKLMRFT